MNFEIKQNGKVFEIFADGKKFTICDYSEKYKRPFMGPVYAPDGTSFTRFEEFHKEHPHQRSLFVGIGDVNGIDFWNEAEDDKGVIRFKEVREMKNGENAILSVCNVWQKPDGTPVIDEERRFVFSETENGIRVDITVIFTASYADIVFGQTKEAGPLGIRVNDFMRADQSGEFTNSNGGINEKDCWGKDALWCNYYAVQNDVKYGIAVFDRKTNERFPTAWHIRDYGLMAANNLYFKGGFSIPAGKQQRYDYTVVFYTDNINPSDYSD